ncbi:MAG: hypothetical protein ACM34H_05230 [Deltaproteobacteria bacterium]
MKYGWTMTMVLALVGTLVWAQAKDLNDEPLYDFLCGSYHVIGRLPDSNQLYSGKIEFRLSGNQLEVVRLIGGHRVRGIGKIETATSDKIKVLRVHFRSKDKDYEATYLIGSDLDNHGRLTGYVYVKGGGTKVPGLEALFIEHKGAEGIRTR